MKNNRDTESATNNNSSRNKKTRKNEVESLLDNNYLFSCSKIKVEVDKNDTFNPLTTTEKREDTKLYKLIQSSIEISSWYLIPYALNFENPEIKYNDCIYLVQKEKNTNIYNYNCAGLDGKWVNGTIILNDNEKTLDIILDKICECGHDISDVSRLISANNALITARGHYSQLKDKSKYKTNVPKIFAGLEANFNDQKGKLTSGLLGKSSLSVIVSEEVTPLPNVSVCEALSNNPSSQSNETDETIAESKPKPGPGPRIARSLKELIELSKRRVFPTKHHWEPNLEEATHLQSLENDLVCVALTNHENNRSNESVETMTESNPKPGPLIARSLKELIELSKGRVFPSIREPNVTDLNIRYINKHFFLKCLKPLFSR